MNMKKQNLNNAIKTLVSIHNAMPSMDRATLFGIMDSIEQPAVLALKLRGAADQLAIAKQIHRDHLLREIENVKLALVDYEQAADTKFRVSKLVREYLKSYDKLSATPVDGSGTYPYYFRKLAEWISSGMGGKLPFTVFKVDGNSKLPFVAFSSLPFADCPGKGECQKWCYSLKAWRYPAAFCRQVQNSLLVRFGFDTIAKEFARIESGKTVRLYVDGDFPSVEILRGWMDLIKTRPDLVCYGYSKSWLEFVQLAGTGYTYPENYAVNMSSGSRYWKTGIENAMRQLDVVRGDFSAVVVDRHYILVGAYKDKKHPESAAYRKQVSEKLKAFADRTFPCPGNCGNCLPNGRHACGDPAMKGVTIGIGIHS